MPQRNSDTQTFTYQSRMGINEQDAAVVFSVAGLMNKIEHCLFADLARGKRLSDLKSEYLKKYKITARHFNAIRSQLEGKIASIKEIQKHEIANLKKRISSLESKIKTLKKEHGSPRAVHEKNRRLATLKSRLLRKEQNLKAGKTPLCFGTRKLFRKQFALKANGYASHEEWQNEWRIARSNSFFLIGSKDETSGNQSCVASLENDSLSIRVRLPDALSEHGKYFSVTGIRFSYGQDALVTALGVDADGKKGSGKPAAISYRFLQDKKGWRLFASTAVDAPKKVTQDGIGVIGVDVNANHLAVVETNRSGNPIERKIFPLCTYGKTRHQTMALIGDVTKSIIEWCLRAKKPLVIEQLSFDKKKCELRETGNARYAQMLSSFSYSAIISSFKSRAFRFGVHVKEVNPAYTSIIGRVKFAKRYGFSSHESAALCIGRRFLGFSERLPRRRSIVPDGKGGHVTLSLPVRNRDKHVWSSWRMVQKKVHSGACSTFPGAKKRSSSQETSCLCDSEVLDLVGEVPTHESATELLGCRV